MYVRWPADYAPTVAVLGGNEYFLSKKKKEATNTDGKIMRLWVHGSQTGRCFDVLGQAFCVLHRPIPAQIAAVRTTAGFH